MTLKYENAFFIYIVSPLLIGRNVCQSGFVLLPYCFIIKKSQTSVKYFSLFDNNTK